jgi:hypothetical protein
MAGVRFLADASNVSVLHSVKTGPEAHLTPYSVGTGALSLGYSGRDVKLNTQLQVVPRSRMMYFHFRIHLHVLALN